MSIRRVSRGGAIAAGVVAVGLLAGELQAQRRGGGGGGGGRSGGGRSGPPAAAPAPAPRPSSAPVSSGRAHAGIGMSRASASARSTGELMYYPGPGFGTGIGQGVGYNLGQGLRVPPGGGQRSPQHGGRFARGWRRGGYYGGAYVAVPYVYSGTYPTYGQTVTYGDPGTMPDETGGAFAPAGPAYGNGPTSILRKPPESFAPTRAEGYPMGRYPVVIRPAKPRAAGADSAARANPGAIGGFVIEEFEAGTVRVRWPDDGRGVREVTLFTDDGMGQRLAWKTLDAAPFTAVFDLTPRTRNIGVTVVRPDSSRATTTVPYRAH